MLAKKTTTKVETITLELSSDEAEQLAKLLMQVDHGHSDIARDVWNALDEVGVEGYLKDESLVGVLVPGVVNRW